MEKFLEAHSEKITGTISCFDRILFKGYLPLGWPGEMEKFMRAQGLLNKDFKRFVQEHSDKLKQHAKAVAEKAGRPYVHLSSPVRKEAMAREIAERDGVKKGLVCILAAVEACRSFKLIYGDGHPDIVGARRKCLCLYFYLIDREFGFMHVRIPTWFPFDVQVCMNGHDWLAIKMDRHGIAYSRIDNAFLRVEDARRAQRFADGFIRKNWHRILSAFARRVNPLLGSILRHMDYYWIVEQAEYSTDVMFNGRAALEGLYEKLLEHAVLCFGAEDVMTFLGKKLHGNFKGEILNDYKVRVRGARVKHRMKENWIKMYDKHGSVLRIETVINHPREFKVRRRGRRNGKLVTEWFPMAKGVANLYRYADVCAAANLRYLDALSVVRDPQESYRAVCKVAEPARRNGRSCRGFNPASGKDVRLFSALMRGEHAIRGFRNRDIRERIFAPAEDREESLRQSARASRLLKRLHIHGLIAKVPRSRRWRITDRGSAVMSMVIKLHRKLYPEALEEAA